MAREMPAKRRNTRMEAAEASMNKVSDAINHGLGNLAGAVIEKVKLKGKPGSGAHTATETGARQAAANRLAAKNNKAVLDSANSTEDFESLISGKKKSY